MGDEVLGVSPKLCLQWVSMRRLDISAGIGCAAQETRGWTPNALGKQEYFGNLWHHSRHFIELPSSNI